MDERLQKNVKRGKVLNVNSMSNNSMISNEDQNSFHSKSDFTKPESTKFKSDQNQVKSDNSSPEHMDSFGQKIEEISKKQSRNKSFLKPPSPSEKHKSKSSTFLKLSKITDDNKYQNIKNEPNIGPALNGTATFENLDAVATTFGNSAIEKEKNLVKKQQTFANPKAEIKRKSSIVQNQNSKWNKKVYIKKNQILPIIETKKSMRSIEEIVNENINLNKNEETERELVNHVKRISKFSN